MTIAEAVQTILKDARQAMHINYIYEEIVRRDLYRFRAKSPKSVLSQVVREKSTANPKASSPIFRQTAPGTYELVE